MNGYEDWFRAYALGRMRTLGLRDWSLGIGLIPGTTTHIKLGRCDPEVQVILVNSYRLPDHGIDTINHEIAHALTCEDFLKVFATAFRGQPEIMAKLGRTAVRQMHGQEWCSHGAHWRRWAKKLGADPRARSRTLGDGGGDLTITL